MKLTRHLKDLRPSWKRAAATRRSRQGHNHLQLEKLEDRLAPVVGASAWAPEVGRGTFYDYDEYHRLRFEVPAYDPRGVVLALDGGRWVGMAATSDRRASGFVFNEMTGVRAGHRGQGLSVAMKTFGIGFAGMCGVSLVRTVHHPDNTRAIAMNRMLGYVDADW